MSLRLNGSTSGYVEIDAPAVAGTTSITFPDTSGEVAVKATDGSIDLGNVDIDASGRLLVGTSTARTKFYAGNLTFTPAFQVERAASTNDRGTSFVYNSNDSECPIVILGKSRGTSAGSFTVVQNGDLIGRLSFQGADGTNLVEGATIDAFVDGAPGSNDLPTALRFSTTADGASSPTERMRIDTNGAVHIFANIRPWTDNAITLGTASRRWSVVYAGTGTINTSDVNLKQDIESLDAAELSAATAIKGLIKKFRFIDAVADKGDDARIHVGVIAQEVEQAFVDAGLDPRRYAMFCEDTLEDGSKRLGIRYDELLAFVIAALEVKVAALEVTP